MPRRFITIERITMSYTENYFENSAAKAAARSVFIRKTYAVFAVALLLFGLVEAFLLQYQPAVELAAKMVSGSNWLIVLLAFMGVSMLANSWAMSPTSTATQYAGLVLYVLAEAVIFLPLMLLADAVAPQAIGNAAVLTAALVAGLTFTVLFSGKDFSFLKSFLIVGSFVAMGLIVCAIIFGFPLGLWFSGAMILYAAAAVIYQTSAIARDYSDTQYVAAALGLFASVALMFWYILQFMLSSRR